MSNTNKKHVLASVFNKKGITKFTKTLNELGYEIISTEGTGRKLKENNIPFISAEKISKNPKGLEDCIKTISFQIEAGILFNRNNSKQVKTIKDLSITPIYIVICNFPPIEEVVKTPKDFNISKVDVGGPLMVRSAAINFKQVIVVVDPLDYDKISNALLENKVTDRLRHWLAIKAFKYCSEYDKKIIKYLHSTNIF